MVILGKEVVEVRTGKVRKSEQKKGYFYTPFSIAQIFNDYKLYAASISKDMATIITKKPLIINKLQTVSISREEAKMLEMATRGHYSWN